MQSILISFLISSENIILNASGSFVNIYIIILYYTVWLFFTKSFELYDKLHSNLLINLL